MSGLAVKGDVFAPASSNLIQENPHRARAVFAPRFWRMQMGSGEILSASGEDYDVKFCLIRAETNIKTAFKVQLNQGACVCDIPRSEFLIAKQSTPN